VLGGGGGGNKEGMMQLYQMPMHFFLYITYYTWVAHLLDDDSSAKSMFI